MAHHAEVMADEDRGQVQVAAQVHEKVQHLGLDRHIQRRHRLVEHQQFGLHGQRAGDRDALTLSARELVRKPRLEGAVQPGAVQHFRHVGWSLCGADDAVRDRPFTHGVTHPHARVQAGERVLVHHLHPGGQLHGAFALHPRHRRAVEQHGPLAGRVDAGHDTAQRRLAAAGFSDQPDDFAALDRQADIGDRAHGAGRAAGAQHGADALAQVGLLGEALGDLPDVQQGA
jgi:hypothetical protein